MGLMRGPRLAVWEGKEADGKEAEIDREEEGVDGKKEKFCGKKEEESRYSLGWKGRSRKRWTRRRRRNRP